MENIATNLFNLVQNIVKNDKNPINMVADLVGNINKINKPNNQNKTNNQNKNKSQNKPTLTYDIYPNAEFNVNDFKSYNKMLAVLHAGLGTGFAIYFNNINNKFKDAPVDGINTMWRTHKESYSLENNKLVQKWTSEEVENSPSVKTIQNLILLFFYITSAFHAYYASNQDGNYEYSIKNNNNYMRWVEYSITSTLMLYIIAILSGVKDENVYRSIFSINLAMIYTGQIVEDYTIKQDKLYGYSIPFLTSQFGLVIPDWTVPMTLGFVLLFTEFNIIIREFNKRIGNLQDFIDANKDDPFFKNFQFPNWIKYTVYSLFLFFSSFGFISLYDVLNKKYNTEKYNYANTEKLYLIFSLLSKATLGAFVAYGLGQRQTATENSSRNLEAATKEIFLQVINSENNCKCNNPECRECNELSKLINSPMMKALQKDSIYYKVHSLKNKKDQTLLEQPQPQVPIQALPQTQAQTNDCGCNNGDCNKCKELVKLLKAPMMKVLQNDSVYYKVHSLKNKN